MTKQDLENQVFLAARDQGLSSVLFRNALGRKLGMSVTDNECLSYLTMKGLATPSQLAQYTGLTSGSTTTMLDRLEKVGYITRRPNPNDRRGVLVEATDKWRQTAMPLVIDIQAAHRKLIGKYTEAELATITDFLQGFTANVQDQIKKLEERS